MIVRALPGTSGFQCILYIAKFTCLHCGSCVAHYLIADLAHARHEALSRVAQLRFEHVPKVPTARHEKPSQSAIGGDSSKCVSNSFPGTKLRVQHVSAHHLILRVSTHLTASSAAAACDRLAG